MGRKYPHMTLSLQTNLKKKKKHESVSNKSISGKFVNYKSHLLKVGGIWYLVFGHSR